jgi:hypothetical protein
MEFKRHPVFPKYKIYSNGDVYREWKSKDKLMKHQLDTHGYYFVGLRNGGKQKQFKIHRLLAILFIPNPDSNNTTVDHINRIRTDNRLENLRWLGRGGQTLNRELKENNTGYAFISKCKNKKWKSGFCFRCDIKRNNKTILSASRAKLEDAVELVRTFLLENEYIFDGLPNETTNKIKEKYKIRDNEK